LHNADTLFLRAPVMRLLAPEESEISHLLALCACWKMSNAARRRSGRDVFTVHVQIDW
jgi:hypothetical protein